MIAFELLFIPLLTIITIVISYISISIILNKRSSLGFIDNNPPALINHISSSIGVSSLDVSESWCNRITIVSMDVEGTQKDLTLILFEADSVPQGTTLTFINNPASTATATLPSSTSPVLKILYDELHFQELIDWKMIEASNILYFRTMEDTNKNGQFDKDDVINYNFINLNNKDWKVENYKPV
jgi:hypothetical protein